MTLNVKDIIDIALFLALSTGWYLIILSILLRKQQQRLKRTLVALLLIIIPAVLIVATFNLFQRQLSSFESIEEYLRYVKFQYRCMHFLLLIHLTLSAPLYLWWSETESDNEHLRQKGFASLIKNGRKLTILKYILIFILAWVALIAGILLSFRNNII